MKLFLLLCLLLSPSLSYGHQYKLDSYGCHNNGVLKAYECHTGKFAGRSWPNPGGKEAMLKEMSSVPPVAPLVGIQEGKYGAVASWQAVEGATTYQLSFYTWDARDGSITQTEIDRVSHVVETTTTAVLLGCLLQGADYYVRVRAVSADRNFSQWSETIHYRKN